MSDKLKKQRLDTFKLTGNEQLYINENAFQIPEHSNNITIIFHSVKRFYKVHDVRNNNDSVTI